MKIAVALCGCVVAASAANAQLRLVPGLTQVNLYEATIGIHSIPFGPNSAQMLNPVANLGRGTNPQYDWLSPAGAPGEYYDIYYSDANGTPNMDGLYITIDCIWDGPEWGANNVAGVELVTASGSIWADFATREYGWGTSYNPGSGVLAADGPNLNSWCTLGQTLNEPTGRPLSVTVGFTNAPTPGALALVGVGGLVALRRRR